MASSYKVCFVSRSICVVDKVLFAINCNLDLDETKTVNISLILALF